ncbi:hypothetical protein D3C71_2176200 [compost metagenome]
MDVRGESPRIQAMKCCGLPNALPGKEMNDTSLPGMALRAVSATNCADASCVGMGWPL